MEEWSDKYNPFNSDKLMAHLDTWKNIKRGSDIPAPITVSIDPANACDLKCFFCNADYRLKENHKMLSQNMLNLFAEYLPRFGTRSVCVGGGGESLLNPHTGDFITKAYNNSLRVGIVTNGTHINQYLEDLANCSWAAVSVDAGDSETYKKIKGRDLFKNVLSNIELLANYSQAKSTELNSPGKAHGVTYKFLLTPSNVSEVYSASKIAKDIGCRNIHIRPASPPWNRPDDPLFKFSYGDIELFREELERARGLEGDNFNVFGITHKFDGNLRKSNEGFNSCYAIFMTGVIQPPSSSDAGYDLGFCCDRRGDDLLTVKNLLAPQDFGRFWGSDSHWEMFDKIKVGTCPRCTYQPHNRIFESVIKCDNMSYDFI